MQSRGDVLTSTLLSAYLHIFPLPDSETFSYQSLGMIISARMLNRLGNITHHCLPPFLILYYLEINPAVLTAAFVFYTDLEESNAYEKLFVN